MSALLAILGYVIGTVGGSIRGGLCGAAVGAGLGMLIAQRRELAQLRRGLDEARDEARGTRRQLQDHAAQLAELQGEAPDRSAAAPASKDVDESRTEELKVREVAEPKAAFAERLASEFESQASPPRAHTAQTSQTSQASARPQPDQVARTRSGLEALVDRGMEHVRGFFTGGNTVVRVGLIVLLVGVVLLLKYAAENARFPIELRMASGALIGIGLIAVGFRQRLSRPGFSLTLQGGGIAAIYLVVFFSFRAYGLIPASGAFALLAALALFSGVMAVTQNSQALIVIGVAGGFLAPVLATTGAGSHVVLFSYYLLLNLLIVGVAWFRSWRPLNLLGFAFTFGIGSTWGALRYKPELFASTEPFLISFFLLYVAIVVIFAWRRPAKLRGWVDGSLTFGAPLATLLLQYQMVKDIPFAMAYTTAGMAAVYIGFAFALQRRAPAAMRNLIEAFLALGIGFGTLAVPYGFSNQSLTGATWAIEGLGLFWLGVRQGRPLSRVAGILLQPLAGVALGYSVLTHGYPSDALPVLNAPFAASALLVIAGLGIALQGHRHAAQLTRLEKALSLGVPWSVLWWYGATLVEIDQHVPVRYEASARILTVAITGLVFELCARRLRWNVGRMPALLSIPVLALLLLQYEPRMVAINPPGIDAGFAPGFEPALWRNPLAGGGFIAWPIYLIGMYFTLGRYARDNRSKADLVHAPALWALAAFAALLLAHLVRAMDGLGGSWAVAALGAGLVAVGGAALRYLHRIQSESLRNVYLWQATGGLFAALAVWQLRTNILASGACEPLPYIPLVNPLDLVLALSFLCCLVWLHTAGLRRVFLVPAAFLWFNGMLARCVHHYADVPYAPQPLWTSATLQMALSVSWTLIGLGTVLWATQKRDRPVWFGGGALLAVVVGKLFLLDLAHLGTIPKIVTFLVVGVLLLVVGYFSPMPPLPKEPAEAPDPAPNAPAKGE